MQLPGRKGTFSFHKGNIYGQGSTISYFAQRGMCVYRLAIVMNISESP